MDKNEKEYMFPSFLIFSFIWGAILCFKCFLDCRKFNKKSIQTTGEILSMEARTILDSEGDSSVVNFATVRFKTISKIITIDNELPSDNYQIGNIIKVFYDPNSPEHAFFDKLAPEKPFLIMAFIFLILSCVFSTIWCEDLINEIKDYDIIFFILVGLTILQIPIVLFSKDFTQTKSSK
jgi:hypothetical protein